MKIIDKYILKRYFATFSVMLFMFIPIGIVIDVSEKINKILMNDVPTNEVIAHYGNFIIYWSNILFPIFLFLSVIWFTSKLANNSEIIAILSSGISFSRFLRPYMIGAAIISLFAMLMGFFIVPKASKEFNEFWYKYLKTNVEIRESSNVFRQIEPNTYLYVSGFNSQTKTAFNFQLETFNNNQMVSKITATRLRYNEKSATFTMFDYKKRTVGKGHDRLEYAEKKDTVFTFDLDDLTPVIYIAETLPIDKLRKFIEKEELRGNAFVNVYKVQYYKKFSLPIAAFVLTIIAVSVSSIKRRGGMGVNLAIGILVGFSYVFFDKVFTTLAEKSSVNPLLAVWFPNIFFGLIAIYLLRNAKR